MAREVKAPEEEGCALWVVTFGDAMSLLVTFFVMLVSFADFEEHQLQETFGALKGGLRAVPLPLAVTTGGLPDDRLEKEEKNQSEEANPSSRMGTEKMLGGTPDERIVKTSSSDYYVHLLANGISIVINRSAVFERGTATLTGETHEVWQVARDLMRSVRNEVRVAVTLPENTVVRLDNYSTPWGLAIEQSLTVQKLLSKYSRDGIGQISTSVQVLKNMPRNTSPEGMVEVIFVGFTELEMKGMPRKILKESWRETPDKQKELSDGQES